MWHNGGDEEITCIACGDSVGRESAREYDKHGDRWKREDKEFEFLCKPCHSDLCHQPRMELEETLVSANAGDTDLETFLNEYDSLTGDDPSEEPEHER